MFPGRSVRVLLPANRFDEWPVHRPCAFPWRMGIRISILEDISRSALFPAREARESSFRNTANRDARRRQAM